MKVELGISTMSAVCNTNGCPKHNENLCGIMYRG